MNTCTLFILFAFEFKFNFTHKYFINNIINKLIDQFCVKSIPNNIYMNSNFKNGEFEQINLTLNVYINTF